MPTDMEVLQRLLAGDAEGQRLVAGINGILSPFFAAAREDYRLSPASELKARRVISAIAQATGRHVGQVIFIDRLHPARNRRRRSLFQLVPDRLDDRVREDHLDEDLGQVLHASLGDTVGFCVERDRLNAAASALLASLWPDLRRRLRFDDRVSGAAARNGLWVSLLYLIGFFLIGNEPRLKRLLPLVKLLPRAIPLGTSVRDPDTWYVLVART